MKKKFLSLLMSAVIASSLIPTVAHGETLTEKAKNVQVSEELRAAGLSEISVYASGDVSYDYNGKTYRFNIYNSYVGWGRNNPFAAVQYAQIHINGQINAGLVVDGLFGAKTYNAIIAYQKRMGLPADGVIGPNTWEYLA